MKKIEPKRKKRTTRRTAIAPKWLICCEGKSEVVYLSALIKALDKESQESGKIKHNIYLGVPEKCSQMPNGCCGRQHKDLYNKAVLCSRRSQFEKVWILFDLDADCDPANKAQKIKNFRDTIAACETDSIALPVWSIPCFEYWLALHSGNRIDVGSVETLEAQVHRLVQQAINDKLPCDKSYRSMPRESHCTLENPSICEKSLKKPYYNSFTALGCTPGTQKACKLCKQVYEEYNPDAIPDSALKFSKIACCSNMHILIAELFSYFDNLPLTV